MTNKELTIIKIGSEGIIIRNEDGGFEVQQEFVDQITRNIAQLRESTNFVLVSSGAVSMGRKICQETGIDNVELLNCKQALASLGANDLINIWQQSFLKHGIRASQNLLNSETDNGKYAESAKVLINSGIVTIFNENDFVATREREDRLIFEDNDTMAARIAQDLGAKNLTIFSRGINGYHKDFGTDQEMVLETLNLTQIQDLITLEQFKCSTKTEGGTGGILTKIIAMRNFLTTNSSGVGRIVDASNSQSIDNYFQGNYKGTVFAN
jgi:glutamate 5-kinase